MPLQLQTDTDIYADDTITHTVGKKLEVVEPKLQNSDVNLPTYILCLVAPVIQSTSAE